MSGIVSGTSVWAGGAAFAVLLALTLLSLTGEEGVGCAALSLPGTTEASEDPAALSDRPSVW